MSSTQEQTFAKQSFNSLVTTLTNLPQELVHRVLDDLPLRKILDILCERNEYVTRCISTHIHYQKLFQFPANDPESFARYWELYQAISFYRGGDCDYTQLLYDAEKYSLSSFYGSSTLNEARRSRSVLELHQVGAAFAQSIKLWTKRASFDYDLLRPYASTEYPTSLDNSWGSLAAQWKWIMDAKTNINATKCRQWSKTSALIAEYPGKITLKKPLDPFQGPPRPNIAHIQNYFQRCVDRALKDNRITVTKYKPGACHGKACELIQVVPYDRYLWYFLDMMKKYPFEEDVDSLSEQIQNVSLSEQFENPPMSTSTENVENGSVKPFPYPPDVANNLRTVLAGLMNIYTGSPHILIPRTDWSPIKPAFSVPREKHPHYLIPGLHRCPDRLRKPHDEREFEWLEAFLSVISWMEQNFGKQEGVEQLKS